MLQDTSYMLGFLIQHNLFSILVYYRKKEKDFANFTQNCYPRFNETGNVSTAKFNTHFIFFMMYLFA